VWALDAATGAFIWKYAAKILGLTIPRSILMRAD
jgi:hypothetical protein